MKSSEQNNLDIVYPLGTGSVWGNNELRYSLRSVEKHAKGIQDVYIIGERPEWLTNIKHVDFGDETSNAHYNTFLKIKYICSTPLLSDNFVLFNDDFFLTQDTDFREFKNKIRPITLLEHPRGDSFYSGCVFRTAEAVKSFGINHFDSHYPMVINKKKFIDCAQYFKESFTPRYTILFRSAYGNMYCKDFEYLEDMKIKKALSLRQIEGLAKGRFCISMGDQAIKTQLNWYFQRHLKNKSKYESND